MINNPITEENLMNKTNFEITPIGRVKVDESQGQYRLHIDEPYRPALMGLEQLHPCHYPLVGG